MLSLLIGGARSGKSALAEQWACGSGREVRVIVTGQAGDAEMAARIAAHQRQRPSHWLTAEAPLRLADALLAADGPQRVLLVDCLTLWLSNLLLAQVGAELQTDAAASAPLQPGPLFERERAALLDCLPRLQADVILIGNEVGHGIVPLGALNRLFVDENGRLHQALGRLADRVVFVMAGCALPLKGG
jgi:adenosylcobinamide kinase/adenosylcobinamide-phosphate guanylyltransferase